MGSEVGGVICGSTLGAQHSTPNLSIGEWAEEKPRTIDRSIVDSIGDDCEGGFRPPAVGGSEEFAVRCREYVQ